MNRAAQQRRNLADTVLDVWAPLSHKSRLNGVDETRDQPAWIELHDWRRLNAYLLRRAYQSNVARHYIVDDGSRDDYREYGDAALFVSQAMAAVLGSEQTIVVDHADEYDPPKDQAGRVVDDPTLPGFDAHVRQQWLRDWADKVGLAAKMVESERQSVGLADSVYVLGWSAVKGRPTVRVYDPGLYFPVIDDDDPGEFPSRVHMLWELEPRVRGGSPLLRRRTWELGGIEPLTEQTIDERGVLRRIIAAIVGDAGDISVVPQPGDVQLPDGRFARRYPWQPAAAPPSTVTCYYTDATWEIQNLRGDWTVDTLPMSQATFAVTEDGQVADRLDLHLDFLPVIHVPNTVAGQEHYGRSVIDMVAQVLDDISACDTDTASSAAIAGTPVIGLSGADAPRGQDRVELAPGEVWGLGEHGRMDVLDTSSQLKALMAARAELLERASVSARMPSAFLGRVRPSEVPSGFALALSFSPFSSLVGEMRLVRDEKYALLLKFTQRLAQAGGMLPVGETPRTEMRFGPYLPADQQTVVDQVVKLVGAHVMSLETGLALLQAAGVDIESVPDEALRVREHDYEAAEALFAATGDTDEVRRLLGLAGPGPVLPEPPPIDLKNQPGQSGA